jgi:ABC-type phosphate/phosphonate transport system substrate-binding protein
MRIRYFPAALLVLICLSPSLVMAGTINMVVMVSENYAEEGARFEKLAKYIQSHGVDIGEIKVTVAKDYPQAAELFRSGQADGMFSGSFVGAILIKQGLAKPVVRPRLSFGISTYKTLVVAKSGTKAFSGLEDFKGKRVSYCSLASAGEIFVRSLLPAGEKPQNLFIPVLARSHREALDDVLKGLADYAVTKNLVWDQEKYKGLSVVGSDSLEHPNNTLLLTPQAYDKYAEGIRAILLNLEKDKTTDGLALKNAFDIKSFISTSTDDFQHTFQLIEKAHIKPEKFNFKF